jgi:colicin import membrane protein
MTTPSLAVDPLRPRPPGGMGRGATLALLVHLGLVAALAVAVRWRTSEPAGVSAELWAAVPQAAAPREEIAPPPPPPPPKPAERQVEPPRDAEIAIEKARKEQLQKERAEREKAEREKAEKLEKAEKEKAALEHKKKEDEEKRLAKLREENIKRMQQGLAGASGGPTATGSAQQSAGPSASYAGRVRAAVYPNITFLGSVPGNPEADVEVHLTPTGEIRSARIVKSSGHKNWDEAVLDALQKTQTLPLDNGRVHTPMLLTFRPRES